MIQLLNLHPFCNIGNKYLDKKELTIRGGGALKTNEESVQKGILNQEGKVWKLIEELCRVMIKGQTCAS